jgi:serine/threonine protein phosphatase PrpC
MSLFIDVGFESINKYGEELCGDKVEISRNDDSVIIVLADGMGSGVKANILSTLTSKIIGTILANGLKIEEAVDTIADTLPVCSTRGLAYSTFSILQIFNSGQGYLVEFDNPAIFRLKKGKPSGITYESRSIAGKTVMESRFKVDYDDMFVMASDGVVQAGKGGALDQGWQWDNVNEYIQRTCKSDISARKVAKLLISAADSLYGGEPGDDATVVAVRVKKPVNLCVMAGPPADPREDEAVVAKLMSTEGYKAICGGTTALIAARVLNRELKVGSEGIDSGTPPVSVLQGVDLVTEGALTLTSTLELIRSCMGSEGTMDAFLGLNRKDGASRLAKLFIEKSTNIIFLVGKSGITSYQNTDHSMEFNLKPKLIEDITLCLRNMGKQVEIEYR